MTKQLLRTIASVTMIALLAIAIASCGTGRKGGKTNGGDTPDAMIIMELGTEDIA